MTDSLRPRRLVVQAPPGTGRLTPGRPAAGSESGGRSLRTGASPRQAATGRTPAAGRKPAASRHAAAGRPAAPDQTLLWKQSTWAAPAQQSRMAHAVRIGAAPSRARRRAVPRSMAGLSLAPVLSRIVAALRGIPRQGRSNAVAVQAPPTVVTFPVRPEAVRRDSRAQATGRVVRGPQRERHEPDYLILVSIAALAAIGILMIYSSLGVRVALDSQGDLFRAIAPQLLWCGLGLIAMLAMMRMDYRWLRLASLSLYAIGLVGLVIVLLPAVGFLQPVEVGNSARWLQIGPLPAVHPAEFVKLALVIYLAHWLAKRGGRASSLIHGMIPFLVISGLAIGLVALEPDLGTTGVITLTAFTMFFVAGASLWQLGLVIPAGIAGLAVYVSSTDYQLARIQTYLDPWKYAAKDGFQTVHGLLALAMGGILGSGLGESRVPGGLQLPNAENDFIFAVVGQEFGLVGGALVIGLYLFFAYRGIRVALGAPDTFGALMATGITAWLTLQALINVGVVVQLIPNTGITLPFISSGGSSLIVSFAAVGILLSISRETQPRGTWNNADPDRGRGYGRPHLPRSGRPALTGRPGR